jgi:hypothetical protein
MAQKRQSKRGSAAVRAGVSGQIRNGRIGHVDEQGERDSRRICLSKTKTNRPDGSYATGDLYTPHPTKPNVWKYVGRGDDVIVMVRGSPVLTIELIK